MTAPDERERRVFQPLNDGEWQAVLEVVDEVPEADRPASLNWSRGWALAKLDQLELATACLRRAIVQTPRNALFHWGLGVVLRDRGDLDAAAEHFVTALSLRDSLPARLSLALVYVAQGKLEDAEQVHLEGLKLQPNDRKRLEAYAAFLEACGRDAEAQVQRQRAFSGPE